MAMRSVTTPDQRAWWTAKQRAMRQEQAAQGEEITREFCLPAAEVEHLNTVARDTRACLISETEILDAIAALEHQIAVLTDPLPFVVGGAR